MKIRLMTLEDALAVAALNEQMGYATDPAAMKERLASFLQTSDTALFVAESDGTVAGWVQVLGVHFLASARSFAEIGGLVVDSNRRRQGIGGALVAEAERWAAAQGYTEVRLRSGLHRTEAHQFYKATGYELAKTSHMFRKSLT